MTLKQKYGIYLASALIVIAVGGSPIIIAAIALLALLTWKGKR